MRRRLGHSAVCSGDRRNQFLRNRGDAETMVQAVQFQSHLHLGVATPHCKRVTPQPDECPGFIRRLSFDCQS